MKFHDILASLREVGQKAQPATVSSRLASRLASRVARRAFRFASRLSRLASVIGCAFTIRIQREGGRGLAEAWQEDCTRGGFLLVFSSFLQLCNFVHR